MSRNDGGTSKKLGPRNDRVNVPKYLLLISVGNVVPGVISN